MKLELSYRELLLVKFYGMNKDVSACLSRVHAEVAVIMRSPKPGHPTFAVDRSVFWLLRFS